MLQVKLPVEQHSADLWQNLSAVPRSFVWAHRIPQQKEQTMISVIRRHSGKNMINMQEKEFLTPGFSPAE